MTSPTIAHPRPLGGKFADIIYGSAEWQDHYGTQFKARRGVMLHAVNLGWDIRDCRVTFLNPANPGTVLWTQGSDGRELGPSESLKRLEGDFKAAMARAVAAPASQGADEVRQRLGVIRGQVAAGQWAGRTGRTDRDVLLAILSRMTEVGCDVINFSERDASLKAGVSSRNTVRKSLRRLTQAGWIERTQSQKEGNLTPVTRTASLIRLKGGPEVTHINLKSRTGEVIWGNSGPPSEPPSHEVWLRLGKAAASIYGVLDSEPRSARRVAAEAGVSRTTCNKHLPVLASHNLAGKQDDGWILGTCTPLDVLLNNADTWLGPDAITAKRRRQIKLDRIGYDIYYGAVTVTQAKAANPDLAAEIGRKFGGLDVQDVPVLAKAG